MNDYYRNTEEIDEHNAQLLSKVLKTRKLTLHGKEVHFSHFIGKYGIVAIQGRSIETPILWTEIRSALLFHNGDLSNID